MKRPKILVTGGAGFIGSHLIKHLLNSHFECDFINFDQLSLGGDLENLKGIEDYINYKFIRGDIRDADFVNHIFEKEKIDMIVHLAAETHVDRSIEGPLVFADTNVIGTLNLLEAAKQYWNNFEGKRFHHVSTDEVYGALTAKQKSFTEDSPYNPHSPYSASKASSDHFVRSYHDTYGLPITISNCSNNYGPRQFPEKLIPLVISKIVNQERIPIYGKGDNIRDWLHVSDHCEAIDAILFNGKIGETYNIGGCEERTNLEIVQKLIELVDSKLNREVGTSDDLIEFVKDRPGHDFRYAIDSTKIGWALDWAPVFDFDEGIEDTVNWYLENEDWVVSAKEKIQTEHEKCREKLY